MADLIKYTEGWKYQLHEDYEIVLPELEGLRGGGDYYLWLFPDGTLLLRKGYAWDGPSGPTIDTKNFMRGSLVHDALYQLIRLNVVPRAKRGDCDKILQRLCREDGMSAFRAWYVHLAVKLAGGSYLDNVPDTQILTAP